MFKQAQVQFSSFALSLFVAATFAFQAPSEAQRGGSGKSLMGSMSTVDLECKHLHVIAQGYLHQHILHNTATTEIEGRTIDQFIKKIDPFKIYLYESDVAGLKSKSKGLVTQIEKQNCGLLKQTYDLYVKRLEERSKFVSSYLDKNFKFNKQTKIILDPDKRVYPKNEKEAQEFHKKYLQFQISNHLAAKTDLAEARKLVARSYDRSLKRAKEYKQTDLMSDYLDSFARSLDPHSSYFSRESLEDFEINMSLQLEGIGATLSSQDGFTIVEQLVPGGAAAKSGLVETQDKIVAVGEGATKKGEELPLENVVEMDLRDVVRKIRGKKGTQVRLKVLRKKGDKTENFIVTLTRDKVSLEDEAASISYVEKDLNGVKRKLGILNLPSFYADARRGGRSSGADLKKLIKDARAKKVNGLVLDLSGNGGGSLEDAVTVAGLFFKTGNVVKQSSKVSKGAGEKATVLRDTDETVDWNGPLVLLTSRVSASASEIVAGTLKDYKRAVVVGADHTFGKGTVQQVVQLPPGLGAIKVTVGMFFTPGGDSTQHRGVDADVVLPSALSGDEIGEKSLDYSLNPQKLEPFISKDAYVKEGKNAWSPIDTTILSSLSERSKTRVAQSKDFDEIREEVKKGAKSKAKEVNLADTWDDRVEFETKRDQNKNQSKEARLAEYQKRPELQEAVNVLVDLIDVQNNVKLKVAAETSAAKTKGAQAQKEPM